MIPDYLNYLGAFGLLNIGYWIYRGIVWLFKNVEVKIKKGERNNG